MFLRKWVQGFKKKHNNNNNNKTRLGLLHYMSANETITICTLYRRGWISTPRLYWNSLLYKWFLGRQRSPAENHIIICWPVCRKNARVCLDQCGDVTGETFPKNPVLHIWDMLLWWKRRILGLHTSSLSLIFFTEPFQWSCLQDWSYRTWKKQKKTLWHKWLHHFLFKRNISAHPHLLSSHWHKQKKMDDLVCKICCWLAEHSHTSCKTGPLFYDGH